MVRFGAKKEESFLLFYFIITGLERIAPFSSKNLSESFSFQKNSVI
jgi:hypothetical protein